MTQSMVLDSLGLFEELLEQVSKQELIEALDIDRDKLEKWVTGELIPEPSLEKRLCVYCLQEGHGDLLLRFGGNPPSYNIFNDFDFEENPIGYDAEIAGKLYLENKPTKIGGFEVSYPLGIPAGALTGTSKWIEFYAKRGFDILTYKTVRTREWPAHRFPQWVFIIEQGPLSAEGNGSVSIADREYWPDDPTNITTANSFGIPSLSPKQWQADIEKANALLNDKQVLIVSVTGTTYEESDSFNDLVKDYVLAAELAKEAGARIVELNFSSPNRQGYKESIIYRDPERSKEITKAVKTALGEIPLFIKIGYLHYEQLAEVVQANADFINGITAINTVSKSVQDKKTGKPIFPPEPIDRSTAGISGSAIKFLAMEVIKNLYRLREQHNYEYDILGVGGITTSQDIKTYLDLGATGVQSCTGAWMNTDLAIKTRLTTVRVSDPKLVTIIGDDNGEEVSIIVDNKERLPTTTELVEKITHSRSLVTQIDAAKQLVERSKERLPKTESEDQTNLPEKRPTTTELVEKITHSRSLVTQIDAAKQLVERSKEKRWEKKKSSIENHL